ncbi:MAG: primosomal protein N' [Chitinispirillales bacterium]|jgi:primosomal protein N' (replication factor Y)|nr:primosomal protein N' [Chitinispirillales bacterium]
MIAEIVFPIAVDGVFDYIVPEIYENEIKIGMNVRVPFRNIKIWGLVVKLKNRSEIENLKEIETLKISQNNYNCEYIIKFYRWISHYYHCPFNKILKPIFNKSIANKKEKEVTLYYINNSSESVGFSAQKIKEMLNISDYYLRKKIKNGDIVRKTEKIYREAGVERLDFKSKDITLSQEQKSAVETILNPDLKKPFLLFGITGSGKTHVYIEVARRMLSEGKSVIILVPEISLTPQTISRFENALGIVSAVIHSRMSVGERRDAIESASLGERKLLIGVRSAVLVPMDNVGLIVVDEEHDSSYKQTDPEPRYNARDIAVVRAKFQSAKIILGSATPSFESFYNTKIGKYERIDLVSRHSAAKLPEVKIVNMSGWKTIISDELRTGIQDSLDEKKQIILLLNRRGYSVTLICEKCSTIKQCPNCSVGLVYHRNGDVLRCHICGYGEKPNYKCENCGEEKVNFEGTGIQKVEDELSLLFPESKVLRMDADTTSGKRGYVEKILDFASQKYDILLGTQMVAKGLDFPNVKLVGVLQADIGLCVPDFRAGEKMFQLLTQVAGRAGRSDDKGFVLIQTFSPNEPSIIYSQSHDFDGYYKKSIVDREKLNYPPFTKIAKIKITGTKEKSTENLSLQIMRILREFSSEVIVLGPVQSAVFKVENKFNFVILLKSFSPHRLFESIDFLRKSLPQKSKKEVYYKIDIDPTNLW